MAWNHVYCSRRLLQKESLISGLLERQRTGRATGVPHSSNEFDVAAIVTTTHISTGIFWTGCGLIALHIDPDS